MLTKTNYLVKVFESPTDSNSFADFGNFIENKGFETLTEAQIYMQNWITKGFSVFNTHLGSQSDEFETPFG